MPPEEESLVILSEPGGGIGSTLPGDYLGKVKGMKAAGEGAARQAVGASLVKIQAGAALSTGVGDNVPW